MDNDRHSRIRQRAYEIWDREGRQHGRADEHWRQAEQELAGRDQTQAASADETVAASAKKAAASAGKKQNGAAKPRAAAPQSGQRARRGSQPMGQN